VVDDNKQLVRSHAILDDSSCYVVALQTMSSEREFHMLHLFVRTLRRHGAPRADLHLGGLRVRWHCG
jgi:hypothetical protein